MTHAPFLFSLLFFIVFIIYLFFGIHIINMNPKSALNRLFLLLCISLSFWAFGFAMANSAPDMDTCLFWRRFSAIGWATVYSLLLHFLLLLTDNKLVESNFLFTIYIPAIISLYAFSFSNRITSTQFNFIKNPYGWTNITVQNNWTLFFNSYYIAFACLYLIILWLWKIKSTDESIRKQANLISFSIIASFSLGTITDVVLNAFFSTPLPQMAPIVSLIFIAAMYLSMKRYNLMKVTVESKDETILSHETLAKLYYYLSIALLIGGLLGFLSKFLPNMISDEENMKITLTASALLFAMGLSIFLFRFIKSDNIKNTLIMVSILFSIPIITLMFLEYASITIWVYPIVLMIFFLVFNTRTPIVLIMSTSVITQIALWKLSPRGPIHMEEFDFILRIGILLLAFWIGTIVNRIYISRLKENILQADFQKLVSEISSDFVSSNQINFDEKINGLLGRIGQFFQIDRSYIFLIDNESNMLSLTHEWRLNGIEKENDYIKSFSWDSDLWFINQLKTKKLVFIADVNKLPEEAETEKNIMNKHGIKSNLIIPVEEEGESLGFIGLDSILSYKSWSEYHVNMLKILSNVLADGLIKIRAEKNIEYLAYYDHLTGLANRNLFSDRLNQAIQLAKRTENFLAVVFLDLDSFKIINDIMGHSGGDIVIKKVGDGLVQRLRKIDTVARFGGDEFLVLINNIYNMKDVSKVADNIMKLFDKPFLVDGQEFFISCSAGIAIYPIDGEDTEILIQNADIAMYSAKSRGKNQYVLCTEDMKEEVKKNMMLSNSLYRALERNEFTIHYQPQIKLDTGNIIGLEALLRWNHPKLGMIPPNVFIPLAEKNGLINNIGEWVLRTACHQNKMWQELGLPRLRMAVNLSIVQFNNPRIVDIISNALNATGLDPKYLELEITESIAIGESSDTIDILNNLKHLGVTVSIDDFGTEYSSLNRLKILPIDRIKIDMQFIQALELSEKDQAITNIIINLAKSLGLKVIAEGVETKNQLEFLYEKSCDEVQGFFYYKPLPAMEIESILNSK